MPPTVRRSPRRMTSRNRAGERRDSKGRSGRESLAALVTPRLEDSPTRAGLHTISESVTTLTTSDFWLIRALHDSKDSREGVIDRVRLRSTACQCQSRRGPRTTFLVREKSVRPTIVICDEVRAKTHRLISNEHRGFLAVHPPFIRRPKAISALLKRRFRRAYARRAQASGTARSEDYLIPRVVARGLTEDCRQPKTRDGPGAAAPVSADFHICGQLGGQQGRCCVVALTEEETWCTYHNMTSGSAASGLC